jgi:hypothetical protein
MAHGGVTSWVDVQYAGMHRRKSGYMYSTVQYVRMHDCTVHAAGKYLLENCVLHTHISVNGMHASSRVTEFLLRISDFVVVYIHTVVHRCGLVASESFRGSKSQNSA